MIHDLGLITWPRRWKGIAAPSFPPVAKKGGGDGYPGVALTTGFFCLFPIGSPREEERRPGVVVAERSSDLSNSLSGDVCN